MPRRLAPGQVLRTGLISALRNERAIHSSLNVSVQVLAQAKKVASLTCRPQVSNMHTSTVSLGTDLFRVSFEPTPL